MLTTHGNSTGPSTHNNTEGKIRCFLCPCGSVCMQSYNFVLHLDYADVVRALECLDGVLSKAPFGFSLSGDSFCACHSGDGSYYLLCRDRVVLRLSEDEARSLRSDFSAARNALDQNLETRLRVM
jgi:hypothetical protein